jgi:hypothetical protein
MARAALRPPHAVVTSNLLTRSRELLRRKPDVDSRALAELPALSAALERGEVSDRLHERRDRGRDWSDDDGEQWVALTH